MNRAVRPLVVLTALVLAASCASGAGGDGSGSGRAGGAEAPAAVDVDLVAAVDEVVEASTGRFEMTVAYEGAAGMDDVEIRGEGEYDYDNAAYRVAIHLDPLLDELEGFGEMSSLVGSYETVAVDDQIYVSSDLFGAIPGLEVEWVRLDPTALGITTGPDGLGLDSLSPGQNADPREWLDQVRAVSDLEEVGTEEVRGVPTRHLSGVMRLGDVAAAIDAPGEDAGSSSYGGDPGALADVTVPIDVYVDDEGLIRRVRQRIVYADLASALSEMGGESALAELEGASMESQIDYFDIGADVEVVAPEGAVDLEALVGDMFSFGADSEDAVDLEELFGNMFGELEEGFPEAFEDVGPASPGD